MPTATQWNHKHEGRGDHVKVGQDDHDRFDGLSADMCAAGCREDFCVITGQFPILDREGKQMKGPDGKPLFSAHCGHPHKGGIQAAHQSDKTIVANFHKARKILAHLAVDRKQV